MTDIFDLEAARAGRGEFLPESGIVALADEVPVELLLTVATNALGLASKRRDDASNARANRNALIAAKRCIERLLAGKAS